MKHCIRPLGRRRAARAVAGFTLLEALIAFLIGGFGLMAVARLQIGMYGESDFAKQLSEATFLGQRRIENLRAYQQLPAVSGADLAAGRWGYLNIASGSQSVAGSNATYTVNWTIADDASVRMKVATVNVQWTDARGTAQTATLDTIIASADPALALGLTVPPSGTPIRRPKNRDLNVPVPAVDLGNGTSWFTPPGAASTVRLVFNNTTGVVTKRCTGSGSDPSAWTCTDTSAYLVSGFIRIDSDANATLTSPIDVQLTASQGTPDGCYDDSASSIKTYAGYITYTCVVIGQDHDSNPGTPSRWSGSTSLTGLAINSSSSGNRVCRFSADYDGNGSIGNYEHPNSYSNVTESLENQNFVVMRGNDNCPGSGITTTVAHQP